jgi:BirA family transcriptional regulator, biotin operon repressor / biotin---[acetyl-CoA-carboxylase] ligase
MAATDDSPLDAAEVERRTGWRVLAFRLLPSTNDEAARVRDREGADGYDRIAIVADAQTAGRGRGGHTFASPVGGLYVSLLLRVSAAELPAPLVLATAVALAEAIEETASVPVEVKWPNDLWIGGKKVAGILVETASGPKRGCAPGEPRVAETPDVAVVIGIGVNIAGVPADLAPDVAESTTALSLHAATSVTRESLLAELLPRLDARRAVLCGPAGRRALESDYRGRLALVGCRVRFFVGDSLRCGVLRDVSLDRGVFVEDAEGGSTWHAAEHVRELRLNGR